jgi:hypothetical protein
MFNEGDPPLVLDPAPDFFRKTSFPSPYMSYVGATTKICQLRVVAEDLKMVDCQLTVGQK